MKRSAKLRIEQPSTIQTHSPISGAGGLAEARLCDKENDGFDAVFLAVGAQQSLRISLDGGFMPDVLHGVEFLRRVAEGQKSIISSKAR